MRRPVKHVDEGFKFLLDLDSGFEEWRLLAKEWYATQQNGTTRGVVKSALVYFFIDYLLGEGIPLDPKYLLDSTKSVPDLMLVLERVCKTSDTTRTKMHDAICDFVKWAARRIRSSLNLKESELELLRSPFRRRRAKSLNVGFDPDFKYLLDFNPSFEGWRAFAARWLAEESSGDELAKASLNLFFLGYLLEHELPLDPRFVFESNHPVPDLMQTIGDIRRCSEKTIVRTNDVIFDFVAWVLDQLKVGAAEVSRHSHLKNPFSRFTGRLLGKTTDFEFAHLLQINPGLLHWQELAAEYLSKQRGGISAKLKGVNFFLIDYVHAHGVELQPIIFLRRDSAKPLLSSARQQGATDETGHQKTHRVKINNAVHDFLQWVLNDKLSIDDGHGNRIVPPHFHNPVPKLTFGGIATPSESVRSVLSIRYIKELRGLLAPGQNFRDWEWAHRATDSDSNRGYGDWFAVDPELVDKNDLDCVWRVRPATKTELERGLGAEITELWSPARAMAIYIKLELPLRTTQVRLLDSGEADTWRYQNGKFVLNESALAVGSQKRPFQVGVFHRDARESGASLFVNTNKTADLNKPENKKGYVIPWTHREVLYWLEKLRNWQERYNSIACPTPWTALEVKHLGSATSKEVLAERGSGCFLFRNAAGRGADKSLPITKIPVSGLWYAMLAELERRCKNRGETLDDGSPIRFVVGEGSSESYFPLHSLRVSLISYLILDLQLPISVVSKLIAGHSRIIMTIYYTKLGVAYMAEVLSEAEKKSIEADKANHRRFLMNATVEQIDKRFSSLAPSAALAASKQPSAAAFIFEDKGICPVGGTMCDVGGDPIGNESDAKRRALFGPVPGYPATRNCVRCRFFLTGPAFLPGLQAHFNEISYRTHETAERHSDLSDRAIELENERSHCEQFGGIFGGNQELEKVSQRMEAEAEAMGGLLNDMQACHYLIGRSIEILNKDKKGGVHLVPVGGISDIKFALAETNSEFHQLEVLCQSAVMYPEVDARRPTLRRSQILDCMLELNGKSPIFYRLSPDQQLKVGNAVVELIKSRAGTLKGAVEYIEGRKSLHELGVLDEALEVISTSMLAIPAARIMKLAAPAVGTPH